MKSIAGVVLAILASGCMSSALKEASEQEVINVAKLQKLSLYQQCYASPEVVKAASPAEYCKAFSGLSDEEAIVYCQEAKGFTRGECESTIRAAKRRVTDAQKREREEAKAIAYCKAKLYKSEEYCRAKIEKFRARHK